MLVLWRDTSLICCAAGEDSSTNNSFPPPAEANTGFFSSVFVPSSTLWPLSAFFFSSKHQAEELCPRYRAAASWRNGGCICADRGSVPRGAVRPCSRPRIPHRYQSFLTRSASSQLRTTTSSLACQELIPPENSKPNHSCKLTWLSHGLSQAHLAYLVWVDWSCLEGCRCWVQLLRSALLFPPITKTEKFWKVLSSEETYQ